MRSSAIRRAERFQRIDEVVRTRGDGHASVAMRQVGAAVTATYAALDRRVDQAANALRTMGVGRGDRVIVLARTRPEVIETLLAASRLGAIGVIANWRLAAAELAAIIADAAPSGAVVALEQLPLLEQAAAGLARIVLPERWDVSDDGWLRTSASSPGIDQDDSAPVNISDLASDVLMLYTSGTTGRPKGVVLSHDAILTMLEWRGRRWQMDWHSQVLVPMPLFHVAGLGVALTTLWAGATVVLSDRADAPSLASAIEDHAVTHTLLVPTSLGELDELVINAMDDGTPRRVESLRWMVYGAAPADEQLVRRTETAFPAAGLVHTYGMTETFGGVVLLDPEDHDGRDGRTPRLGTVGRALPGVDLQIVDPDTEQPRAPGEIGEIWIRTPTVMSGYWRQPEVSAQTLVEDGWLRTGDLGAVDDDGYLRVVDRLKDLVITGGENVYPAEIERVLAGHPSVAEVAVIGVPHRRWGESVHAVVVASEGSVVDASTLIDFARQRLAHYKCPTGVTVVEALPRNATGKVQKPMLRALVGQTPQRDDEHVIDGP